MVNLFQNWQWTPENRLGMFLFRLSFRKFVFTIMERIQILYAPEVSTKPRIPFSTFLAKKIFSFFETISSYFGKISSENFFLFFLLAVASIRYLWWSFSWTNLLGWVGKYLLIPARFVGRFHVLTGG